MKRQPPTRLSISLANVLPSIRFVGSVDDRRQTNPEMTFVSRMYQWSAHLLTKDLFPSWNTFLRHFKTPLAVLLYTSLVTFLCGLLVAPQIFLMCAASTCVIAVGMVYPWLAIRAVKFRIEFPRERISEGDVVYPKLLVHNKWPIPVWGLAVVGGFDAFNDASADDHVSVALAHVPAWSRTEFRWEFTPRRRGVYPQGGVMLTSAFPFGLWKARKQVQIERNVVVWPLPLKMKTRPCSSHRHARSRDASTIVAGKDAEAIAIRPYRSGDVMRDVHWSATARLDELMVKERQRSTESHTRVILSVSRHIAARLRRSHDNAPLDWAIRFTAGLCEAYSRANTPMVLEFGKQCLEVKPTFNRRFVMDALALADLAELETGLRENASRRSDESQIRIDIDVNEDDGSGLDRYAIEITSSQMHESSCRRIDLACLSPATMQEFQQECLRLNSSLNQKSIRRRARIA